MKKIRFGFLIINIASILVLTLAMFFLQLYIYRYDDAAKENKKKNEQYSYDFCVNDVTDDEISQIKGVIENTDTKWLGKKISYKEEIDEETGNKNLYVSIFKSERAAREIINSYALRGVFNEVRDYLYPDYRKVYHGFMQKIFDKKVNGQTSRLEPEYPYIEGVWERVKLKYRETGQGNMVNLDKQTKIEELMHYDLMGFLCLVFGEMFLVVVITKKRKKDGEKSAKKCTIYNLIRVMVAAVFSIAVYFPVREDFEKDYFYNEYISRVEFKLNIVAYIVFILLYLVISYVISGKILYKIEGKVNKSLKRKFAETVIRGVLVAAVGVLLINIFYRNVIYTRIIDKEFELFTSVYDYIDHFDYETYDETEFILKYYGYGSVKLTDFESIVPVLDSWKIYLIIKSNIIFSVLWIVICVIVFGIKFLNKDVGKDLEELKKASDKILDNDLDFEIKRHSDTEVGALCDSFGKMKDALKTNYENMWQDVENRKKLNSIFMHELKTPITVMSGYLEMMEESGDTEYLDKVMNQVKRMQAYTEKMGKLQKMEDMNPELLETKISKIIETMETEGKEICINNEFVFSAYLDDKGEGSEWKALKACEDQLKGRKMNTDFEMLMHIYGNLVSNADSYAKSKVEVKAYISKDVFKIIIKDDGEGFSKDALENALEPFYKDRNNEDTSHYGIGLYVCRLFSEKLGGSVRLENEEGGKVVLELSINIA